MDWSHMGAVITAYILIILAIGVGIGWWIAS